MITKKLGKWVMVGLVAAAMAAPLTALAAQGTAGPKANTRVAQAQQVRPDCPNGGVQLRDGSGRTREGSLHQNRGAGLRDGSGRAGNRGAGLRNGTGPRNGAGNRGPAQS
jgi:hypothetical protein